QYVATAVRLSWPHRRREPWRKRWLGLGGRSRTNRNQSLFFCCGTLESELRISILLFSNLRIQRVHRSLRGCLIRLINLRCFLCRLDERRTPHWGSATIFLCCNRIGVRR